jgi:CBS domain-containing protein
MTVAAILKAKGDAPVRTIPASASLAEAVEQLAAHRIGALVVSRDGERVEGIVSERDLVRVLARQGAAALEQPVHQVMTREVQHCARGESSEALLKRMTAGRFRHLPVLEDGKLVAIISIGDVVKHRIGEIEMEKDALEGMIKGY